MKENLTALSIFESMPSWMVFVLAILIVVLPTILDFFRQRRNKNTINQLVLNHELLYKNFNMLLDILYEKYANNLTLEVSKAIIELVYDKTKNCILTRMQEYIHDNNVYVEGTIDPAKIKEDLKLFISNKYYHDAMLLNKMSCKGHTLDKHLKTILYDDIVNKVISLLVIHSGTNTHRACACIKRDLDNYFTSLISKGKTHLETLIEQ